MNRAVLLSAAALALAGVATSSRSAPPGEPPPHRIALADRIGTPEAEPLLRLSGLSEAGIAALRGTAGETTDELSAARCAVEKAAGADPLDLAALARALEQRDRLAASQADRRRTQLLRQLRVLAPADARLLLRLVGTGEGGPPGGPPPAGPGGPPPGPPPGARPPMACTA